MTPVGELRSALIPNGQAEHIFEVWAHPFTAGETIAQARLGALRVNGQPATCEVVDVLGTGDYVLRITTGGPREAHRDLVLVGREPELARSDRLVA